MISLYVSVHFCARCSILSCNSAVSILRIDTAELHRVYDSMLQRAQKCIDVQGDHFQHLLQPVNNLHLFNFLYRVRDLRPRRSTRRRAGFSCSPLYVKIQVKSRNIFRVRKNTERSDCIQPLSHYNGYIRSLRSLFLHTRKLVLLLTCILIRGLEL